MSSLEQPEFATPKRIDSGSVMSPPPNLALPLFVYGALKPGMPAFERIRAFAVRPIKQDCVEGRLFVRDGLPLLLLGHESAQGFLLQWHPSSEADAYRAVCEFEPRKHYEWAEVTTESGINANTLVARFPDKGNPQPLHSPVWRLTDDPAFSEGVSVVREASSELENERWGEWQRFFRAQMAYLLLWSILERLSALCFGPDTDPHKRATSLHELPGMSNLIRKHVQRTDRVSDSRDPSDIYKLDASSPKKCFSYYYQVRCNLSHRGKGVWKEMEKVQNSLKELLAITEDYLKHLRDLGEQR